MMQRIRFGKLYEKTVKENTAKEVSQFSDFFGYLV